MYALLSVQFFLCPNRFPHLYKFILFVSVIFTEQVVPALVGLPLSSFFLQLLPSKSQTLYDLKSRSCLKPPSVFRETEVPHNVFTFHTKSPASSHSSINCSRVDRVSMLRQFDTKNVKVPAANVKPLQNDKKRLTLEYFAQ